MTPSTYEQAFLMNGPIDHEEAARIDEFYRRFGQQHDNGDTARPVEAASEPDVPDFEPIPAPDIATLFPSRSAAEEYLIEFAHDQGFEIIKPKGAQKKKGLIVAQQWICAKGKSNNFIIKRKEMRKQAGFDPMRNKKSKKTGCTFSLLVTAMDHNDPSACEWRLKLGTNPVHNHPAMDPTTLPQHRRRARDNDMLEFVVRLAVANSS